MLRIDIGWDLGYIVRNELALSFICNKLQSYHPTRTLRPASCNLLLVRWLKKFGHRSFQYMASTLWNQLPDRHWGLLSCFKSNLNTFLMIYLFIPICCIYSFYVHHQRTTTLNAMLYKLNIIIIFIINKASAGVKHSQQQQTFGDCINPFIYCLPSCLVAVF